ncbi:unnamed protein product, partial [marine sediment metagenome]
ENWIVSYESSERDIRSLTVYNGKLYAGSTTGGMIFVYDEETWSECYNSDEDDINCLAVYNGKLYAGSATGGIVFVARSSSLSDLAVDANGFLTALMKGQESGAGLHTIATDGGGRMIGVIRDPTSDNYMAIDDEGFMQALMKGKYGAAFKTIATDSDGRMLATIRNFPYEDTVLYADSCSVALGASGYLQTAVVAAGKIWVVTNVCTYADTSYFSAIILAIRRDGGFYRVRWGADTNGGVNSIIHDSPLYLKAGDRIQVDFDTAVAATDCFIHVNGYILP